MPIRPAAVAGTWYPGTAAALTRDVDGYLQQAADWTGGPIQAVLAPHAGLMFSGPVGAHAYRAAASRRFDVIVLAGPSHFVAFEGVSIFPEGAFATPLGDASVDRLSPGLVEQPRRSHAPAQQREHCSRCKGSVRRLFRRENRPLVMGFQTRDTIVGLAMLWLRAADGGVAGLKYRAPHYFDAQTANGSTIGSTACLGLRPGGLPALFEGIRNTARPLRRAAASRRSR